MCGQVDRRPATAPLASLRPPAATPPARSRSGWPSRPPAGAWARAGQHARPGPATGPGPGPPRHPPPPTGSVPAPQPAARLPPPAPAPGQQTRRVLTDADVLDQDRQTVKTSRQADRGSFIAGKNRPQSALSVYIPVFTGVSTPGARTCPLPNWPQRRPPRKPPLCRRDVLRAHGERMPIFSRRSYSA